MPSPDLMRLLHDVSPYEGHDVAAHRGDLHGWNSDDPVFRYAIEALRPRTIVEVGTWQGASAIHMGQVARELGLQTRIICVDTWLGSPEHFLGLGTGWREALRLSNGYPRLYFTFLTNVIEAGLADVIIPLPATSENAAIILEHKQIQPDLVYIDAAHEYEAVKRDIAAYWRLLGDGGVLLGDDYGYAVWPGVTRAAIDFATENGLVLGGRPGKFVLSKNAEFLRQVVPSLRPA